MGDKAEVGRRWRIRGLYIGCRGRWGYRGGWSSGGAELACQTQSSRIEFCIGDDGEVRGTERAANFIERALDGQRFRKGEKMRLVRRFSLGNGDC